MIDTAQFVVHCGHIILYAVVNLVCLGLNRYIEVLDKRLDQQERNCLVQLLKNLENLDCHLYYIFQLMYQYGQ